MKSEKQPTTFQVAFKNDKGLIRDNNEDDFILNVDLTKSDWTWTGDETVISLGDKGALFVVADGMGGLNAGEVAAHLSVEAVKEYFTSKVDFSKLDGNIVKAALTNSILYANQCIVKHAAAAPESKGMGTTLSVAWLLGNAVYFAWVGDSRIYLQRQNEPLRQLNKDHSLVQELVDAGKITEDQAFYHPDKNIITQSLGDSGRNPEPSFGHEPIAPSDRLLLCSDGLNTMINDAQIGEILTTEPLVKACADRLVQAAKEGGGHDNITVVLCDVEKVVEGGGFSIASPGGMVRIKKWIYIGIGVLVGLLLAGLLFKFKDEPKEGNPTKNNVSRDTSIENRNTRDTSTQIKVNTNHQTGKKPISKGVIVPDRVDSDESKGIPETPNGQQATPDPPSSINRSINPDDGLKRLRRDSTEKKQEHPISDKIKKEIRQERVMKYYVICATGRYKDGAEREARELKLKEKPLTRTVGCPEKVGSPCYSVVVEAFFTKKEAEDFIANCNNDVNCRKKFEKKKLGILTLPFNNK